MFLNLSEKNFCKINLFCVNHEWHERAGNEDDPCLSVLPVEENKQPPASSSWGILQVSLNLPPIFGSLTDNGEEEDYDDSDRLLE